MPSSKYTELINLTDEELKNELEVTRKQYHKMRFDKALKGIENPITLREARRDVARMLTEIRRRELNAEKA